MITLRLVKTFEHGLEVHQVWVNNTKVYVCLSENMAREYIKRLTNTIMNHGGELQCLEQSKQK